MYQQVEKTKENKSRAVANSVAQKKGDGRRGFGFVDNRTKGVTQNKLTNTSCNDTQQQHPLQMTIIDVNGGLQIDDDTNELKQADGVWSLDLTGLISSDIKYDEIGYETVISLLGEAYKHAIDPKVAAEIQIAIRHLREPENQVWSDAPRGKKQSYGGKNLDEFQSWFKLQTGTEKYQKTGEYYALLTSNVKIFSGLSPYEVGKFTKTIKAVRELSIYKDVEQTSEGIELLSATLLLITLRNEGSGMFNVNVESDAIKKFIEIKASKIHEIYTGIQSIAPPKVALVRTGALRSWNSLNVGTRSEIKTGLYGALESGEASEGAMSAVRELNETTDIEWHSGHLVANTLGGKESNDNLVPMNSLFNTTSIGAMKESEILANKMLKSGKVIFYRNEVTHWKSNDKNSIDSIIPKTFIVIVAEMKAPDGKDKNDIYQYIESVGSKTYTLNM